MLSGYIKTEQLTHDVAFASILFYDKNHKLVETHESKHYREATRWTRFRIGPLTPASDDVRSTTIALHLKPAEADGEADLSGAAMFDDLSLGQLPRVSLETNSPHNVYSNLYEPEVMCRVSGISDPNPLVQFQLLDVDGKLLLEEEVPMKSGASRPQAGGVFSGSANWKPIIPDYGFYRVRVSISGHTNEPISTTIALLQWLPREKSGEFGWTLPSGDNPLPLKTLLSFLSEVGIHWVKFPVWYGDDDHGRADQLAWFAERLSSDDIKMIGMLDTPPAEVRQLFGNKEELPVASIFVEPELWQPAVDPVMTRLSLKVRWWQLGADNDTSFVNFPNLEETLGEIRQGFNRFGQQINLGIPWRSIDETPTAQSPPWSFLSYVAKPALTANEMSAYLPSPNASRAKRWLVLEPLAKSEYSLETRARDLVARMLAAKMERVDGMFVPDPFDPEHGLMNQDGTPGKMLLPWRTTAMMLAGAKSLGSITMPNGSSNQIFTKGDQTVMVLWNDEPTNEVIYLGSDVWIVDVWGRKKRPREVPAEDFVRQEIKVGRMPVFVTGVDPAIARWRMAFHFEQDRIASVFGQEQAIYYRYTNAFDQGVGGMIELHTPDVWQAASQSTHFKLSANEVLRRRMDLTLEPNANAGPQDIRIDFQLTAVRTYKFSIYRTLHVGLGDILVELTTRLDEHGNLVVEQRLINNTDRFVSFNCMLSTQKRRRERRQVFNRGRGATTIVFAFPNGEELLGDTLWLRVEEIDGSRILNHQVIASP
ncbi:MAG: hypothetical protein CMJ64_22435 [Planctomycetaceae bacterium]|nr:hypothetical protein [Planctomycetaceae bacterium]